MIGLLGFVLLAMLVVMAVGWAVQLAVGNAGWADVFWTYGTGLTCALAALVPGPDGEWSWRRGMAAGLIALWSLRLGTYVGQRVAGGGEDARYRDLRAAWGSRFQARMLPLMLAQAPATTILSVSVILAARAPSPHFRLGDAAGLMILLGAILGEGLADGQMKRFKQDPANKGKVCDTGLWAWSRHPNYFFEFLAWLAWPAMAIDPARPWTLAALAGPALMFVILRYLTGAPPLEAAMLRSRGEAYRRYQSSVSPFLPRPPKKPESQPA